jgi:pyruvate dehydrogenase kinase 2/3/4
MENSRIGALRSASSSDKGVRATVAEQVDRWNHVKSDEAKDKVASNEPHPRIGIGLPMSNIFAT